MVKTKKSKTDAEKIAGILPKIKERNYNLSKAIRINYILKVYGRKKLIHMLTSGYSKFTTKVSLLKMGSDLTKKGKGNLD